MKVNSVLRNSLMMYPSLYTNKFQVYEHLFLVIGNGYEWVNGALVSDDTKHPCTKKQAISKIMNWHVDYDIKESFEISDAVRFLKNAANADESEYKKLAEEYVKEYINGFRAENIRRTKYINQVLDVNKIIAEELHYVEDESAKEHGWKDEIYPLCEYSKIMNIPDNIKPDWKAAVKEFYNYLMTSDIEIIKEYREKYMVELKSIEDKLK